MKKTTNKLLSLALAAALAAGLLSGCGAAQSTAASAVSSAAASSAAASSAAASGASASAAAIQVQFTVTGADGASTNYTLDASAGETLASALENAGLISKEEGDAGFVTTVDGVTADYNKDKAWWKLLDGKGEMTATGIADIQLADGDSYSFVYTIGS